MSKTEVKAIRMDSELSKSIQKLAKLQNRNFSNMAETLLKTIDIEKLILNNKS